FQAEDGIRDGHVTGVQTCALPIYDRVVARRQYEDPRLGGAGLLVLHDGADQVPGGGIDPARKRPAARQPIATLDRMGATAREDQIGRASWRDSVWMTVAVGGMNGK